MIFTWQTKIWYDKRLNLVPVLKKEIFREMFLNCHLEIVYLHSPLKVKIVYKLHISGFMISDT